VGVREGPQRLACLGAGAPSSLLTPTPQPPAAAPLAPLPLPRLPPQARVNVPDDRFNWLCDVYKPKSSVPAFLDIVDIAGLVR
jgi:hypothetical protein